MRSLGWALIQYNYCSYKKGKSGSRDKYAQREDDVQPHRKKMDMCLEQ